MFRQTWSLLMILVGWLVKIGARARSKEMCRMFTHKLQVEARIEYLGQQAREYVPSQFTAIYTHVMSWSSSLVHQPKKRKNHRNQLLYMASCRCRTFRDFFVCSPLFGRRSSLEWTYHSYSGGRLLTRQNGCCKEAGSESKTVNIDLGTSSVG